MTDPGQRASHTTARSSFLEEVREGRKCRRRAGGKGEEQGEEGEICLTTTTRRALPQLLSVFIYAQEELQCVVVP